MIHFKIELIKVAMELLNGKDELKAYNDINLINNTIKQLNITIAENQAYSLHNRLVVEYPTIQILLAVANTMEAIKINKQSNQHICEIVSLLNQDKFGILCEVLIKHSVISTEQDFIDYVEDAK